MLFEYRKYTAQPGRRDDLVSIMEAEVIPFQSSLGVVVVASFVDEEHPDIYVWIRRFDDEEHRKALYEAVYQSDHWKNVLAPKMPELMDRTKIEVTRLVPTPKSVIR